MASDPPHVPPDHYRTFHELPGFTRRWADLGLTDGDRIALMATLMADPSAGPVVRGAGRFRKARFAPPSWGDAGKSGAVRVYYAHLPGYGVILLGSAYGKTEAGDLSAAQRSALARLVAAFEAELKRRRDARRGTKP